MNQDYLNNIQQAIQKKSLAMVLGSHFENCNPWNDFYNNLCDIISNKNELFKTYLHELKERNLAYDIFFKLLYQNNHSSLELFDGFKIKQPSMIHQQIAEMIQKKFISYLAIASIDNQLDLALQSNNLKAKRDYTILQKEEDKPYLHWLYGKIDDKKSLEEYFKLSPKQLYSAKSSEFLKSFEHADIILVLGYNKDDFGWNHLCGLLMQYAKKGKTIYWITQEQDNLTCNYINKISKGDYISISTTEFLSSLLGTITTNDDSIPVYDFSKSFKKFENSFDQSLWDLMTGILLNQVMSRSHARKVLEEVTPALETNKNYKKAAIARHYIGTIFLEQGFQEEALDSYIHAIELLAKVPDYPGLAQEYAKCAEIYFAGNDLEKSIQYFGEALSLYEQSKCKENIAEISGKLALLCEIEEDYELAQQYYQQNFQNKLDIMDYDGAIMALINCGNSMLKLQQWQQIIDLSQKALDLANQYKELTCLPEIYQLLGICYINLNDYKQARKYYEDAHQLYQNNQDLLSLNTLYCNLGHICARQSELTKAIQYYELSLPYFEKMGEWQHIASIYTNLGLLYTSCKQFDIAEDYFSHSEEIYAVLGDVYNLIRTHTNLAKIYLAQNQLDNALECYNANLDMLTQMGNKEEIASTLFEIGMVFFQKQNFRQSLQHFEKSLDLYKVLGKKQDEQDLNEIISLIHKQQNNSNNPI